MLLNFIYVFFSFLAVNFNVKTEVQQKNVCTLLVHLPWTWPRDWKLREGWWVSKDGDPVGEVQEERWTEGRPTAVRAASPPETNQTIQQIPVPGLHMHTIYCGRTEMFMVNIMCCSKCFRFIYLECARIHYISKQEPGTHLK